MEEIKGALEGGAKPQEVMVQLIQSGMPPESVAQVFVQLGMPEDQIGPAIEQAMTQAQGQQGAEPSEEEMMAAQQSQAGAPAPPMMRYGGGDSPFAEAHPLSAFAYGGDNDYVETGEGLLDEDNFIKTKRKRNGKIKQKEISEKRFNRIQDRYERKGGHDGGDNPNVDNTVNRRGNKSVSDMNAGIPWEDYTRPSLIRPQLRTPYERPLAMVEPDLIFDDPSTIEAPAFNAMQELNSADAQYSPTPSFISSSDPMAAAMAADATSTPSFAYGGQAQDGTEINPAQFAAEQDTYAASEGDPMAQQMMQESNPQGGSGDLIQEVLAALSQGVGPEQVYTKIMEMGIDQEQAGQIIQQAMAMMNQGGPSNQAPAEDDGYAQMLSQLQDQRDSFKNEYRRDVNKLGGGAAMQNAQNGTGRVVKSDTTKTSKFWPREKTSAIFNEFLGQGYSAEEARNNIYNMNVISEKDYDFVRGLGAKKKKLKKRGGQSDSVELTTKQIAQIIAAGGSVKYV